MSSNVLQSFFFTIYFILTKKAYQIEVPCPSYIVFPYTNDTKKLSYLFCIRLWLWIQTVAWHLIHLNVVFIQMLALHLNLFLIFFFLQNITSHCLMSDHYEAGPLRKPETFFFVLFDNNTYFTLTILRSC